ARAHGCDQSRVLWLDNPPCVSMALSRGDAFLDLCGRSGGRHSTSVACGTTRHRGELAQRMKRVLPARFVASPQDRGRSVAAASLCEARLWLNFWPLSGTAHPPSRRFGVAGRAAATALTLFALLCVAA